MFISPKLTSTFSLITSPVSWSSKDISTWNEEVDAENEADEEVEGQYHLYFLRSWCCCCWSHLGTPAAILSAKIFLRKLRAQPVSANCVLTTHSKIFFFLFFWSRKSYYGIKTRKKWVPQLAPTIFLLAPSPPARPSPTGGCVLNCC